MPSGHEGHAPGEYSAPCRACRIAGHIERIEALALGRLMHCEHREPAAVRTCHVPTSSGCAYCRRPICATHQADHRRLKHDASDLAAREAIKRVVWTEAHLSALRVAVTAQTPLHNVLTWAENATREVTGGRR